jgi:hypothetical protein
VNLEFAGLASRLFVSIGFVVLASLATAALFAHSRAAPTCDSEQALNRVSDILRAESHLDSVFLNDIKNVSGGWFSTRRECAAQITEIRGNVSASNLPWRDLRYSIAPGTMAERADIEVKLGSGVALAGRRKSLWKRLLGYF